MIVQRFIPRKTRYFQNITMSMLFPQSHIMKHFTHKYFVFKIMIIFLQNTIWFILIFILQLTSTTILMRHKNSSFLSLFPIEFVRNSYTFSYRLSKCKIFTKIKFTEKRLKMYRLFLSLIKTSYIQIIFDQNLFLQNEVTR